MSRCHFIPPYLLNRIASAHVDPEIARCGHATLAIDEGLRSRRTTTPPVVGPALPSDTVRGDGEDAWTIHTANNGSSLPGEPVRSAGEPEVGDLAVDEAYVGTEASVALFSEVFGRESYDGRGAPVIVTVHYERNYDNAFWDGRQLVFGDGDGQVFDRFTKPIDVLGHEFTHAVTQYTAALTYEGQSGALNESMSDVFASCMKQRVLGHSAADADWLIGEGIFMPSVNGRALRSMAEPGTAYDDPVVGKDPQVGSMSDYVETTEDNGGVHINSGIPNRAFYLVATELGGASWETAGQVWYRTLTSGELTEATDFAGFAAATVAAAEDVDASVVSVVERAWRDVGVLGAGVGSGSGAGPTRPRSAVPGQAPRATSAVPASGEMRVRRTGGFAGITQEARLDLDHDPRAYEAQQLLARIDFAALASGKPQPDRFAYVFELADRQVTVHEQNMTRELAQLADLVLRASGDPER